MLLQGLREALVKAVEHGERSEFKARLIEAVERQLDGIADDDLRLSAEESPEEAARRFVASRRARNEWDELVGPFLDTAGVMEWLQYAHRMNVTNAAQRGDLLAVPVGRRQLYPRFQFSDSGQLLPGLRSVRAILAPVMDSPWTQALWLTTPVPAFGGFTPAALLHRGDVEAVVGLARADADRRSS